MTDEWQTDLYAEDVEVGDSGPEVVVEDLERKDFVKYAGASGDFNPIHYDEPYATGAGNDSVFAQGMLSAGFVGHMVADWLGLANVRSFGVRFRAQVWPEDTIAVSGEIVDVTSTTDGATIEAELIATNQDGDAVVTGSATAELPSRS